MTNPAAVTPKQMLARVKKLTQQHAINRLEFSELIYNLAMDVEFHQSLGCESWAEFVSRYLQMPYGKAARHIAVWEHFGIRLSGCFNPSNPPPWRILKVMVRFTDEQNVKHWWKEARTMGWAEVKEVAAAKAAQVTGNKGVQSVVCHQFNVMVDLKGRRMLARLCNKVKHEQGLTSNGDALLFIAKTFSAL